MKTNITDLKVGQQKFGADIANMQEDTALIPLLKQALFEIRNKVLKKSEVTKQIQDTVRDHEVKLKRIM